jgi:CubicO group peptidase (beta-lactamase class C family)
MSRKITSRHRAVAGALSLALAVSPACYRAPTKTGSDQVHDPNIEATIIKDNALAAKTWEPVDTYMQFTVVGESDEPGCALGVARGGQLLYLKGYGKAEVGGESWGVGTVGAVGSVSKTFTAAGLLLMHQLGLVDINGEVGDHLATGNPLLASANLFALLNHTSGVGGATKDGSFSPTWEPTSDAQHCLDGLTFCDPVERDLAEPRLGFAQYEDTEAVANLAAGVGVYSNVGYSVAGAIIDDVAIAEGYDGYEEWIWDRVGNSAPELDADNMLSLALTHSWRDTDFPHRAVGYRKVGDAFATYEAFDPDTLAGIEGWEGPSGGWAMTIGDLTRFALALNTGQIVNSTMLAVMRFDWANLDEISDNAGMGMLLGTGDNAPYWHGGVIGGHTAMWAWWDDLDGQSLGITMICNRDDLDPFTLRNHATMLSPIAINTSPVAPAMAAPPPFALPGGERSWVLDRGRAWQSAPAGAFLPITALLHDSVVSARLDAKRFTWTFRTATVEDGHAVPVSGQPAVSLGTGTYRNPEFTTAAATITVPTTAGSVQIRDFVLDGAIDRGGAELTNLSLRGTLDARQVAPLVGQSATGLCAQLATTGASCAPCSDGSPTCLAFRYDNVSATAVTM